MLPEHYEGGLSGVHFAVWKAARTLGGGSWVPAFRAINLEGELSRLTPMGVVRRHEVLDIRERKRVVTLSEPDGNAFRLIQIDSQ
jgi:hypothetical protein